MVKRRPGKQVQRAAQRGGKKQVRAGLRVDRAESVAMARMTVLRWLAISFDLVIMYVPAGLLATVGLAGAFMVAEEVGLTTPTTLGELTPWAVGTWVTGFVVVETLVNAKWGTTPGKRLAGLQVTGMKGLPAGWRKYMLRALVKHLPIWLAAAAWAPAIYVISAGWVYMWLRKGTTIHDRLAGTSVTPFTKK